MADLLKKGAQLLARVRKDNYSVDVTVRRVGHPLITIRARLGTSRDIRVDDAAGLVVGIEMRDFVFAAADYDFGFGPTEPVEGDVICDASSGENIEYDITKITGEDGAGWADRYGVSWRVHTRRRTD